MKRTIHTLADLKRLKAAESASAPAHPPPAQPPAHAPDAQGDVNPTTPAPANAAAPLSDSDRVLFRQAMRHVRPLTERGPRARAGRGRSLPDSWLQARRQHAQGSTAAHRASPEAAPPHPPLAWRHTLPLHDPAAQSYLQPGCGPDILRHLRRGKWAVQATLDLHGSHLEQAIARLERFLASCQMHAVRCVRIVHGKGIGSRNRTPVLKDAIRQHLSRLESVQAWVQCAERDGGAGAVTALLRLPEHRP